MLKAFKNFFTVIGILSTIYLFHFSNQAFDSSNRLTTQSINAIHYLSNHNLIITNPSPFPPGFLQSTYRYYLLASEGREPSPEEASVIQNKEAYIKLVGVEQAKKINEAQAMLKNDNSTINNTYNLIFIFSVACQFLVLIFEIWSNKCSDKPCS